MIEIDISEQICDLDGTPIPLSDQPNAPPMTLGHVLIRAALQAPMPGAKPYTADQHTVRYTISLDVNNALKTPPHTVRLPPTIAREMCEEIARTWPSIVVGQAIGMMKGKKTAE